MNCVYSLYIDFIIYITRYDAIDNVENNIPDISEMYKCWTANYNIDPGSSKKITLPEIPKFLVITGDLYSLYELPHYTENEGLHMTFNRSGKTLTITKGDWAGVARVYVYIWY